MSELLPCPFCGGEAYSEPFTIGDGWYVSDDYQVICGVCGTFSKVYQNEKEAIKAWNSRVERTCTIEQSGFATGFCSECGGEFCASVFNNIPPDYVEPEHYCPCCGAKVVSE